MKTESTGFAGGLWLTVIGIFCGLGFVGGYVVAANHATTGIKKREAEWNAKSAAYFTQESKRMAEVASLKSTLTDKDRELAGLRQKEKALSNELQEARAALAGERKENNPRTAEIKPMLDLDLKDRPLLQQFLKAKQGFTDIKTQVSAGHFKGLESTDGFQILSAAFEEENK